MNWKISPLLAVCAVLTGAAGAAEELYPIVQGGKWGYMDKAGKVVIQPQYDNAWDFSEGLAAVEVNQLRGYIDPANTMVIKPAYAMSRPFVEGLAGVCVDAGRFGSMMDLRAGGRWIFIDKTGKQAFPTHPDRPLSFVDDFHEGEARVKFVFGGHPRETTVNTKGVMRPGFPRKAGRFSEGLVAFPKDSSSLGFVDKDGKHVMEINLDDAGDFCDGLAPVKVKGQKKWTFIDKTGKTAFPGEFDDARNFAAGLASVSAGGKWGCVDKTGKTVIEPKYDFVAPLSEGLARVILGAKHGFIDASGKVVIEPKFDVAWEFSKGLARVEADGKTGYIDKTGAFIWQPGN
jgi:hypothetical protein